MALIVVLATIGVASALWSKTLTIDGSVATGTVSIEFVDWIDHYENEGIQELGLKDVADCVGSFGIEYPNRMGFDVINGYPGYECWAVVHIINTGNIPVHIYRPDVTTDATSAEITFDVLDADLLLPGFDTVPACYADDTQIHSGDTADCTLHFRVEQGALQDHTYTYEMLFEGRQYNEPRP